MDFSHYTTGPVQMAVDLVNTRDPVADVDGLAEPDDVLRFLEPYEESWPHPVWKVTESDLHEVRAVRARLRSVFWSEDEEEAADLLNALLADVVATPRVSVHQHGDPHLHFEPLEASPARWLGAVAAMGMSVVLCDYGLDRLGVCDASSCDDVYLDTSRNRSRRNCSDTCTTRENVAAYRRRQKAG